jgi:hypothetical protein
MRTDTLMLAAFVGLGLTACVADSKDWMKVGDQKFTKAEFQKDYRECIKDRAVDEACMRDRGWVSVNPSKGETPTPDQTRQPRRGGY